MEWNSERIEQLRLLWHDGLSASQIAAVLGGITRNAVIGKAHRLGLTGRPSPIKAGTAGSSRPRSRRPRVERPSLQKPAVMAPPVRRIEAASAAPIEDVPGASILTLTDRICKWPIGDPRDADFHFCGRASSEGLPYCSEHARRAYQAPVRRSGERDDGTHRFAFRR
jgi:GcrA cell cycle regulator